MYAKINPLDDAAIFVKQNHDIWIIYTKEIMIKKRMCLMSACLVAIATVNSSIMADNFKSDLHLATDEPLLAPKIEDKKPAQPQPEQNDKQVAAPEIELPTSSHDGTRLSKKDRRLRKRKSKTTRHTISTMTFDELREAKNRKLQENNVEIAIKYAEKMLPICKDMHELKDLTIELADLYFHHGDLEKAGKLYNEFTKLYPGYDKIEHAKHKAILCSFYSILNAENDQTKTKETIALTQEFLERSDIFTQYASEVENIQKQCYRRLVESDKYIVEYYLNRDSFNAAQTRINNMRKDYGTAMPNLEPELLSYEIQIAQKRMIQNF